MDLQSRVEASISSSTGQSASLAQSQSAHGGCINDSRLISLEDGRQFFLKTNSLAKQLPGMFAGEYLSLQLLLEPGVIHVPRPVAYADDFVVIETFRHGQPAADWQEQMGRQLAQLHVATKQSRFGFENDNYLGTTPQPNPWCDSWLEFFREHRLRWQLQLFEQKTGRSDPLIIAGQKLIDVLDTLIGQVDEPAVLLHGDLWSGNAAADENGAPVIFDPASYYGHREAEIGMMRLFGGFGPRCEAAYAEVWPLQPDAERRIDLYRLYHELNDLNLFGHSYYQTCLSTMESLL